MHTNKEGLYRIILKNGRTIERQVPLGGATDILDPETGQPLAALIPLTMASYRFIEQPGMRVGSRLIKLWCSPRRGQTIGLTADVV